MKDKFGNELSVGDKVLRLDLQYGNRVVAYKAIVVRVTEDYAWVDYQTNLGSYPYIFESGCLRSSNRLIKIDTLVESFGSAEDFYEYERLSDYNK